MAKTYAQFKAYVTTYLWRDNDTDLANNLDSLIDQADDELDTMTRTWQRRQKTVVIAPTSEDFSLTANVADFQAVDSLVNNSADTLFASSVKVMKQLPLVQLYGKRAVNTGQRFMPFYAIDRNDGTLFLRLIGPFSVSDPGDMTLVYRIGIPDYAGDDASWMEDEYLNLYLYTVLKHCAMFLREDERVETYAGLQNEAFSKAEEDDKHNLQFGGSPLYMRPHRYVP